MRWRIEHIVAAALGSTFACATPPKPPPSAVVVPVTVATATDPGAAAARGDSAGAAGADGSEAGTSTVIVKASRAASRSPESPRVLRKLLSARHGQLQIAHGYTRVSLIVESVVSGALDDPYYAKRPIGVNVLPVVLLDEAAFAANDGLDGFEGRWKLTRRPDGTLVASAIGDTPFAVEKAQQRTAARDRARASLRGATADERNAGLDALGNHSFLDLVPEVIALLDDTRTETPRPPQGHMFYMPRVVREAADHRLRALMAPFGMESLPKAPDRSAWESFWRDATRKGEDAPVAITPSTVVDTLKISSSQSFADAVGSQNGVLLFGVSRLATPIDGHAAGLALGRPGEPRTWIGSAEREGLEVASGTRAIAALHSGFDGAWTVTTTTNDLARPRSVTLAPDGVHAAIAAGTNTFAFVSTKKSSSSIFGIALDADGQPRGAAKEVKLPEAPATEYHRGVHPIGIARKSDGWLVAVETQASVLVADLDDAFRLASATPLAQRRGIARPRIATSTAKDRAFVVWTRDGLSSSSVLVHAMVDRKGHKIGDEGTTGSEVQAFSAPLALDDGGFALAWVEASSEVHLARFSPAGERLANVVLQARDALQEPVALTKDARGLVVANVDTSRFPYSLVVRRVDPSAVK